MCLLGMTIHLEFFYRRGHDIEHSIEIQVLVDGKPFKIGNEERSLIYPQIFEANHPHVLFHRYGTKGNFIGVGLRWTIME